jgi:hypothetical protein
MGGPKEPSDDPKYAGIPMNLRPPKDFEGSQTLWWATKNLEQRYWNNYMDEKVWFEY